MKFSVSSNELQRVLGNVGGVIPSKSTLPILENFLFDLENDKLTITATDLEISISIKLVVKGMADGKIAVPAKRVVETVRALPNTDVMFSADPGNNRITMTTGTGEYRLSGESSENYPSVPVFEGHDEISLDAETVRRFIGKTIFAVSTDELRPAMMGVLFQLKKSEIRAVATDGHRLVRLINTAVASNRIEKEVIIPAKALNLLLKAMDDHGTVLSFNETHAMFSFGGTVLITRMIEEKYPNYESVIPLDNEKKLIVDRNKLLASVRRTSLYASTTTHQVRLSLSKGSMTVSAEDIDFGSEAKETLDCEYTAEKLEIGFNSVYMLDVLSHIDTEEVEFMLNSPTRACIVKPTAQHEGENILMLVMPVRLNV